MDGVLGLSQGAAVAAALVVQQQLGGSGGGGAGPSPATGSLRFAILCSGYRSPLPEHRDLLAAAAAAGGARLPSLHIYGRRGGAGGDRQVSPDECAALVDCFDAAQRQVVQHSGGHVIPSSGEVAAALHAFLLQQCVEPTARVQRERPP